MNSLTADKSPLLQKYEDFCGEGHLPHGKAEPGFYEEDIFEPSLLKDVLKVVSKLPGLTKGDSIRTNVLVYEMHEVTFSKDHKLIHEKPMLNNRVTYYTPIATNHLKKQSYEDTLYKARKVVLERFASVLGLSGTHKIWTNCLRYALPPGEEIDVVKWHSDHNKGWTMVTMMTDPNGKAGWKGGDILVAPTKLKPSDIKGGPSVEVPVVEKAKQIPHKYNSAIFFHNHETNHTVTPLIGTGNGKVSERIIWTCEDHCPKFCADT